MNLGQYNTLRAERQTSVGLFLEDDEGERVLLPQKWVPKGVSGGDELEVFIYLDNEERPIATTMKPKATVGGFAFLEVKQVMGLGAFLDWGLEKDLFVPFKEQHERMQPGKSYVVHLYIDEKTYRITASAKIERFVEKKEIDLEPGEEVELLIGDPTPLGYKVIINNRYLGLMYENETFKKVKTGDRNRGFVKNIREDGKVDVILEKPGYDKTEPHAQRVLEELRKQGGFLPLHDKSSPQLISERLEMSKKSFKKAIGGLYKDKLIKMEEDGIRLM